MSLSPLWESRLIQAFDGILTFERRKRKAQIHLRAESTDHRTLIQTVEGGNRLISASIQLAFPQENEFHALKLGCWTLLFLKSFFPDWEGLDRWVQEAGEATRLKVELNGYLVSHAFNEVANVMEFVITPFQKESA